MNIQKMEVINTKDSLLTFLSMAKVCKSFKMVIVMKETILKGDHMVMGNTIGKMELNTKENLIQGSEKEEGFMMKLMVINMLDSI